MICDKITRQQNLSDAAEVFDLEEALKFVEFKLPPPRELSVTDVDSTRKSSMTRIWNSSKDVVVSTDMVAGSLQEARSQELPMLLLVRMITRTTREQPEEKEEGKGEPMEVDDPPRDERLRHVLFDYILTNFPARSVLFEPPLSQFQGFSIGLPGKN